MFSSSISLGMQDHNHHERYTAILAIVLALLGWFGCEDTSHNNRPPAITSPTNTTAIVDLPYSYTATADDPDHDTIEIVYTGLPSWLVVDGKTVRGTPETVDTFQFDVTAEDNEGKTDRITVSIEVQSNANLLAEVVAAVSIDSLLEVVGKLSGVSQIDFFTPSYTILSRHPFLSGNEYAAQYLEWKLASYGLLTGRFNFNPTGSNVIALQQGSTFSDSIYIIGAHYDCNVIPEEHHAEDINDAPGADNNASGVAALLETARILGQYICRYSILYVLWDENEFGLSGSEAYAEHTLDCGLSIAGVIDMDMIAYDHDDNRIMSLHGSTQGRSTFMVNRAANLIEQFDLDLVPQITMQGLGSDNVPFHLLGYSTLAFSEDTGRGSNYYDHQSRDTIDKFNLDYYYQMSRLIIATIASLVGVESTGSLSTSTFWFCV